MLSRTSFAKRAERRPRDRRADDRRHTDRRQSPSVRQLPEVTTLVENGLRLTRFVGVALLLPTIIVHRPGTDSTALPKARSPITSWASGCGRSSTGAQVTVTPAAASSRPKAS